MLEMINPKEFINIFELVSKVLIPLILVWVGYLVNRASNRHAYATEHKLKIFDDVSTDLNDLYCYFMFLGHWKELEPLEIITKKRKLDRVFYPNAALFSKRFFRLYIAFIKTYFRSFNESGEDAKLRTPIISSRGNRKLHTSGSWEQTWDNYFASKEYQSTLSEVHLSYYALINQFSKELGL